MKKIPTIFKRDPANLRLVLDEPHPSCDWVFQGEGVATRKYDGTCCLLEDQLLYKRREVNKNDKPPDGFRQCDYDPMTGKTVGWILVDPALPENKWHIEAIHYQDTWADGTYELIGPKVQGNPEGVAHHVLVSHGNAEIFDDVPWNFVGLREWLRYRDIEGLVFHHPDGRMAKIKKRDFGLKRK